MVEVSLFPTFIVSSFRIPPDISRVASKCSIIVVIKNYNLSCAVQAMEEIVLLFPLAISVG